MSLGEVMFPLQLATSATGVERMRYASISVKAFYCGIGPNNLQPTSPPIPTQVSLRDTLHYISFKPPQHGFYRLKVLVNGREHTPSPLLHILSDGTLLASTLPGSLEETYNRPSGLITPENQNSVLFQIPARVSKSSPRITKKSDYFQQKKIRNKALRSNIIHEAEKKFKKLKKSRSKSPDINITALMKDIPFLDEQKVAPWGMGLRRQSQSLENLHTSETDYERNGGKTKISDIQRLLAGSHMQTEANQMVVCCICGTAELTETEHIYLLKLYFCLPDFQRLYLNRSAREHFLVPVIQTVYLSGIQAHGQIPQVNLKGMAIPQIKKCQQYFNLIDHKNEGWIPKSQTNSLIVRLLTKMQLIVNYKISTTILKGQPYLALVSGMGLDKRLMIHEIEFLACVAFVVREYRDMQALHMMKLRSQNLLESATQYMAESTYNTRDSYISNLSGHYTGSSIEPSDYSTTSYNISSVENGQRQTVSTWHEPADGWMLY